ncbi:SDR family NAD(P)-dependent oxidoreductase [Flavobacteriales bacterium]|nr:SDR family NAD(P)-dependent oxidoreductase [Flavobacteriales bacterium]
MNILITGVSSGIGWGLAKHYLELGHTVFGLSRRTPKDLIKKANFNFAKCDLTNFNTSSEIISHLISGIKTMDLVILNAGILGPITDMKMQKINNLQDVMNVNVWANKPVIDTLIKNIPSLVKVVAISSGASINGNKGWGGYSISKAALNMLIKLYASENKKTLFYSLAPGLVDTAMQDYLCGNKLNINDFPAQKKLKSARNTASMPQPEIAAKSLSNAIKNLNDYNSGEFIDIRNLSKGKDHIY